jgi:hypothetical protein
LGPRRGDHCNRRDDLPISPRINNIIRMNNPAFCRIACFILFTLASTGDLFARTTRRYSSSSSSSSSAAAVWIMIIALVVFFGGLIWFLFYLDRRRSDKIQAIVTRLGYTFRRKPTDADRALIVGCHIANAGHGHITSNVIEVAQTDELRMTLFDHVYTVGYGKSSQQYKQTVSRMQSSVLNLPSFILFPETFFSKLGKLFGGKDINFPEAPLFSKKYILRGPDEAAIRALFTPALLQFFEQQQRPLIIDAAGDTLFAHRTSRRAKPEEIQAYVDEAKQILAQFFQAQTSRGPAMPPPLPV